MTRIGDGSRPPLDPTDLGSSPAAGENAPAKTAAGAKKTADAGEAKVLDSFQRVAPQLTQQLSAMAGKKAMPGVVFTNEHLYQVALMFAGMLRKNPGADRRARARMFAKAILRSKRFGSVFDRADEADLERAYDLIGDQLDGSPVLAQLVEEVTEGARKMNLG